MLIPRLLGQVFLGKDILKADHQPGEEHRADLVLFVEWWPPGEVVGIGIELIQIEAF